MRPALLRTGQIAAAAGVNVQTLRYYERRDVLRPTTRSPAGHRLYAPRSVTLLRMIKIAQALGFALTDIREMLADGAHGRVAAELAARRIEDIDRQLSELTRARNALVPYTAPSSLAPHRPDHD